MCDLPGTVGCHYDAQKNVLQSKLEFQYQPRKLKNGGTFCRHGQLKHVNIYQKTKGKVQGSRSLQEMIASFCTLMTVVDMHTAIYFRTQ